MSCCSGWEGKPKELFPVYGRGAVWGELGQCIDWCSQPPSQPIGSDHGGLPPLSDGVPGKRGSSPQQTCEWSLICDTSSRLPIGYNLLCFTSVQESSVLNLLSQSVSLPWHLVDFPAYQNVTRYVSTHYPASLVLSRDTSSQQVIRLLRMAAGFEMTAQPLHHKVGWTFWFVIRFFDTFQIKNGEHLKHICYVWCHS